MTKVIFRNLYTQTVIRNLLSGICYYESEYKILGNKNQYLYSDCSVNTTLSEYNYH